MEPFGLLQRSLQQDRQNGLVHEFDGIMSKGRVASGLVQIGAQEDATHTVQAKQLARGLDPRTAVR
jgi:hypothetical protein